MEDARASTSSQRLASTFDTCIESSEADITAMPVVRPESFPAGNNRDIPVSVQELVYGGKAAGVGNSAKSLDRYNELLSSRTSPTDKILVEKPKHVVRGPEEDVGPRKGQQPSGRSPSLHKQNIRCNKCQTRTRKPQRASIRSSKRKSEKQNTSETFLNHRITEFPERRRQP
ncbi:hypothetical protein O181_071412 [Austropuccinia psidii MF-1]|uniref:Uncharacterized protein n=1 Tax=Austropuccinia psidii MF-1 TaxID=1389203 RepID=A0A9Q3F545_9BASI|nr:hypothetical protein [Austropuccinia psidii MF-1]